MRIAHIITRLILGGAQENTVLCCDDLIRQHGDEVLLITGPALGPEGSLIEEARSRGIPLKILDCLRRPIHPLRDWQSYRQLKQTLREFQPDVVHTHSAKGGFLGRLAASAVRVPAIVHTVHGAPFHPYQSRGAAAVFRLCERYAAGKCHALISVADAMTDLMVDAQVATRDRFTTIYSGMDVEPFLVAEELREQVRSKLGYSEDHIVVGKIARLFHLKGHEYVIRAAKQVIASQPNVRFLFVGDGILRERLQQQIDTAGLSDHFHFVGQVDPSEIPGLLAAMDIVVHASLREGLARVLPQALIARRPVVSYDIDGAREVVEDGQTGFLLPPESIEALASAIQTLASDAEMRGRLGNEGQKRWSEPFRHEQMNRSIRELYTQILEHHSGEQGESGCPDRAF